jgi:DNA-3-methyladenine glycosylase II
MKGRPVTLDLGYTPPLDWPFFLQYLGNRATAGVEEVDQGRYARTIEVAGRAGTLVLAHHPKDARLILTIRGEARGHPEAVLGRVGRMFDLEIDLASVHSVLGADPRLGPLLVASPGIRVPGAWSPFELLVRTIVGQQVTVKAATTIMGRIARRFGQTAEGPDGNGPSFLFPSPRVLADGDLGAIGMPSRRVAALQHVARAIADGAIPFPDPDGGAAGVKEALLGLPGIGPWTVEYFALRALRDADAWPGTDLVLRRSLQQQAPPSDPTETPVPERWRPYRGYAAMHLWNKASLDRAPR